MNVCERLAAAGPGDGQGHGDPLGLASLSDPRRCVRDDGNPADRDPRWSSTRAIPAHWPFIGSVVDYVDGKRQAGGRSRPVVPRNLVLPWAFSSQRVGEVARAGPYGGFLGQAFDPICTEFVGKGTKKAKKTLADKVWDDLEPYRGITPESRFQLGSVSNLGPDLTLDRLDRAFDPARTARAPSPPRPMSHRGRVGHRPPPRDGLRPARLGEAPARLRPRPKSRTKPASLYGMTLFGQASLTARRLVEAGGRFVTVFWDEYGLAGTGWDTHWDHFPRMKDELLPGLDRTLSGLLIDLDRRGLLDETLVVLLERARPDAEACTRCRGAVATTGRGATRS